MNKLRDKIADITCGPLDDVAKADAIMALIKPKELVWGEVEFHRREAAKWKDRYEEQRRLKLDVAIYTADIIDEVIKAFGGHMSFGDKSAMASKVAELRTRIDEREVAVV